MQKVIIRAPAKLNLALNITGVLPNGYHTIDSIMQTVSIWETVEITKSDNYSLRLPGSRVPANDKNTATKAAKAFFSAAQLAAGANIIIKKAVPTRAGLAGGSADAAAVLVGLNALYETALTKSELCKIGANIGADVPFAITGGTARVTGIGEILTPLPPLPKCWFAIAMPHGIGVSTPAAYNNYDELGSPLNPDIDSACTAINAHDLYNLVDNMQNVLEYSNGGEDTKLLRKVFDECGAIASMMTGSGAAVFGMFEEEQKARDAAYTARAHARQTFVARPVQHGPQIM